MREAAAQLFLDTMTYILPVEERIAGLTPGKGDTQAERRSVLQAKWRSATGKCDIDLIQRVCDAWENGEVEVDYQPGEIILRFVGAYGVPTEQAQAALQAAVLEVIPAHLAVQYVYRYLLVLLAVAAAAAYDPEGNYAVGDYCTQGGKLHKCNTPIQSGEAWNAQHWTETSVAAELSIITAQPQEYDLPLEDGITPAYSHSAIFYKTQNGIVHVECELVGNFSNDTVIGVIPPGYRPKREIRPTCSCWFSPYQSGAVVITKDGDIAVSFNSEVARCSFYAIYKANQ